VTRDAHGGGGTAASRAVGPRAVSVVFTVTDAGSDRRRQRQWRIRITCGASAPQRLPALRASGAIPDNPQGGINERSKSPGARSR
jgi:hypothetical protein